MVADGSLEPGKREKAKNSQSGRCKAEARQLSFSNFADNALECFEML
jgi:hypothetical protein